MDVGPRDMGPGIWTWGQWTWGQGTLGLGCGLEAKGHRDRDMDMGPMGMGTEIYGHGAKGRRI